MKAKRKIVLGIWVAVAAMIVFGNMGKAAQNPARGEKAIVQGNTAFAADLYRQIKSQPGNLCFSPYGISTAMAMTYAGAQGQTEREMAKTMRFALPQKELPGVFAGMGKSLQDLERAGITLTVANALWCQAGYNINPNYTGLLQTNYHATVAALDFGRPSASVKTINSWFSGQTKGMIQNMISARQIDSAYTRAILGNAVYFNGKWKFAFNQKATKNGRFYPDTNTLVEAPMMTAYPVLKIIRDNHFQLLELPYTGGQLSMIVLLPDDHNGLPALEKQFTADNLKLWLGKMNQAHADEVHVQMPRLKITRHFALDKTLAQMGMPSLFSPTNANLSGISGKKGLSVSSIAHQAVIDINEEGTEAAAGTVVHELNFEGRPPAFIADHPFLYLIMDNRNGNILFCGRVVDPTKG